MKQADPESQRLTGSRSHLALALSAMSAASCAGSPGPAGRPDAGDPGRADAQEHDAPGPDAAPGNDPSARPPIALLVWHGRAVVANPTFVVLGWASDPDAHDKAARFLGWLGTSPLWQVLAQYGVHAATTVRATPLATPPPATLTDPEVEAIFMEAAARGAYAGLTDVVPVLVLPKGTTVVRFGRPATCVTQEGFHGFSRALDLPLIVVAQCADASALMTTLAHEAAEATTDPFVNPEAWRSEAGEVADLCQGFDWDAQAGELGTVRVPRLFSNATARSGADHPCQPAPDAPYAGAALDPAKVVLDQAADGTWVGHASIVVFDSARRSVDLDWFVTPLDGVTVTPSSGTARPGTRIPLTITAPAGTAADAYRISLTAYLEAAMQAPHWGIALVP